MKTLLLTEGAQGQARSYLAKRMLESVAAKLDITLLDAAQDAELIIVIGDEQPQDTAFNGKRLFIGSAEKAIREPEAFLAQAMAEAQSYQYTSATAAAPAKGQMRIVAVTACPTGVAHTFMAAEAIEAEAKKRGWWVKVETRGSVGAGNEITPEEVAAADLVIVAADIEVDLNKFSGKPMYRTTTGLALKKTAQELDKALVESETFTAQKSSSTASSSKKKEAVGAYRHLLTGVSYMLPMVVAGGLCIALSFVFGIEAFKQEGTLAAALMQIGGGSAFALMVPVLAGYIAFSIADRPGLTPGLIGGMLAVSTGAGFLGGIIAGFLAGYVAKLISTKLHLPQSMEALKPILIIPLIASLITGLAMIYIVGKPVAAIMEGLTH
ncbi:MAG: fructose-specific PTS transporter subunit EIIC, partial [Hafnia sp.]